ncbi:MAG TPA: ROK family protein [Opitutaceae bacterium]|jgi:glucokinase
MAPDTSPPLPRPKRSSTIQAVGAGCALGVDIGGSFVKLAWFDAATGEPQGRDEFPTRDGEIEKGVPRFAASLRTRVKSLEGRPGLSITSIGVAAPGLAALDGRSISHMPGRLQALQGLDWTVALERMVAVPVLNDAHAALLGEAWKGIACGKRHVVMLTLGTGVGGAVLAEGRLLKGALGRAGHLGHTSLDPKGRRDVVGTPGSLEDRVGECTLKDRTGGRFKTTEALLEAVRNAEEIACIAWEDSLDALAAAVVSFINIFDPEMIVLGGGVARAGNILFEALSSRVKKIEWTPYGKHVPIVAAQLSGWAGAYGAAFAGLNAARGNTPSVFVP